MSFSAAEAIGERQQQIDTVAYKLQNYPTYEAVEEAKFLARVSSKDGHDDLAFWLMHMANRAEDKLDWAYDESVGN